MPPPRNLRPQARHAPGSSPKIFSPVHAAAYSIHSRIRRNYAEPLRDDASECAAACTGWLDCTVVAGFELNDRLDLLWQIRLNRIRVKISRRALLSFFCSSLFGNLGAIGLVGPDEPRYVWIARAMAATGDWVTPRLYGQPWFEKPILYYWAAAIGFLFHLPAEWACGSLPLSPRWPPPWQSAGSPAALRPHRGSSNRSRDACAASVLHHRRRHWICPRRHARHAFQRLPCACHGRAAAVLRYRGLLRSAGTPNRDRLRATLPLIFLGIFAGLAVLAKGPAALILAGGAVGLWALLTKKWRPALRLAHPYAIFAFCLVALPWYVLCALRNPDFLRVFILQHNFERYLTPVFQHPQPFWFFVPITLLALLPWTALLWPAAQEGCAYGAKSPGMIPLDLFSPAGLSFRFCSSAFPNRSFRATFFPPFRRLPCSAQYPACAQARIYLPKSECARSCIGFTWLVLGLSAVVWLHRLPVPLRTRSLRILFAAALAIVAGLCLASPSWFRKRGSMLPGSIADGRFGRIAGFAILPRLDPFVSARWHAQLLRNDRHPDRIFVYHLPRSWAYGLPSILAANCRSGLSRSQSRSGAHYAPGPGRDSAISQVLR